MNATAVTPNTHDHHVIGRLNSFWQQCGVADPASHGTTMLPTGNLPPQRMRRNGPTARLRQRVKLHAVTKASLQWGAFPPELHHTKNAHSQHGRISSSAGKAASVLHLAQHRRADRKRISYL